MRLLETGLVGEGTTQTTIDLLQVVAASEARPGSTRVILRSGHELVVVVAYKTFVERWTQALRGG